MSGAFEGKIAIVTGAGSGIGQETAWAFAKEGATVFAGDVNTAGLEQTAAKDKRIKSMRCDVTSVDDVMAIVAAAEAAGGLDVAANCAGIAHDPASIEVSEGEVFDRVMRVNAYGVWLCMRYEAPALIKRGGGAIVNVASTAALTGAPQMAAYAASKHACLGLTRSAAYDLAPRGVRVNAVCPGPVATPMLMGSLHSETLPLTLAKVPAGRLAEPRELADAILYLASDRARYAVGAALTIDGGMTLF